MDVHFRAVAVVSYQLTETPDRLQGRVISSFRMISYGAESLGMALGGLWMSFSNPLWLFGLMTAGLSVGFIAALRLRPYARP